ncbi:acetolactate synthase [miscellaneous Crenarchaeota group-15 archaeon DG-45]|uniref:Acetolactate synthase n=1 Tax=miscellaneous Crenarchaeota group-15 archaeon DG-45 TaxID=1685127 RepID=A0A0M0BRL8_9ARCH|nr:MAG: acetolactate synthase [miscellaneous Crenarchaeota group-15 archaeon DG-45]
MSEKRCWDVIVDALEKEGVRFVFGLPGHPAVLYDSLYDAEAVEAVLVRHETSGAFMAMAYARLTRQPGVCFGSPGPGVANLIPGVLEAQSGCTPLIALGSSASSMHVGMGAFQETPQVDMFRPITKGVFKLPSADRAAWTMRRAFSLASNGKPGPIYVDVPFDVGTSTTAEVEYVPSDRPIRIRPDPERVKEAADLLLASERPVIVAGGGAYASAASGELIALAERLGIPVLTTPCGRGVIPESHPLALGLVGLYRTRVGRRVYQEADLLITLGSRNEEFQTAAWRHFPEGARFVQVDIDPSEMGRNWVPDVAVVGDAKLVLRDLMAAVSERARRRPLEEMPRVRSMLEAKEAFEAEVEAECADAPAPLKSKRVVREANRVFGSGTVLVNENGSQDLWSYYFPYYKVLDVDGCVAPAEQTCMGFGVAGAIGAKLAAPDRKVICTTGDGAFQMFMKELPTAVQCGAPVTWIVLNNFSLGWIKLHERALGDRYIAVDFEAQPDFAAVAEACGCHGERVDEASAVRPALEDALRQNEAGVPVVLDFIVDPWDFSDGFKEFHTSIWG